MYAFSRFVFPLKSESPSDRSNARLACVARVRLDALPFYKWISSHLPHLQYPVDAGDALSRWVAFINFLQIRRQSLLFHLKPYENGKQNGFEDVFAESRTAHWLHTQRRDGWLVILLMVWLAGRDVSYATSSADVCQNSLLITTFSENLRDCWKRFLKQNRVNIG